MKIPKLTKSKSMASNNILLSKGLFPNPVAMKRKRNMTILDEPQPSEMASMPTQKLMKRAP